MIEVSFEAIEDDVERRPLEGLPITFRLEPADVDRLKAAVKKVKRLACFSETAV